jgi:hypothetical protein
MSIITKLKTAVALAALVALLVPAGAIAQSGTDGYAGPNNVVAGLEESGGGNGPTTPTAQKSDTSPVQAAENNNSSLPFTGADLGVLAGAGVLLLGMGVGLRRLTHRPTQA